MMTGLPDVSEAGMSQCFLFEQWRKRQRHGMCDRKWTCRRTGRSAEPRAGSLYLESMDVRIARNRHMQLFQIFLPLCDNQGTRLPFRKFEQVKDRLVKEFGGVTAFLNSPGEGVWRESPKNFVKDNVVTFEVMSDIVDRDWWNQYKGQLENDFGQEEIVIRTMQIEVL